MTWANSTGETVDQADVALGYVYGPAGNQLTGSNNTITSTDPTVAPANWSGSFGMEQPAPTAVAIGVAIPGVGVGTATATDPPPAIDPLTPNQVAEGVTFIGANGVVMEGTLVADCPSQFSVCLQDNGGNPIHGAIVFASTDQAGADAVDSAVSDQAGNAEFTLSLIHISEPTRPY